MRHEQSISRRSAMKLIGASSVAGLAGCLDSVRNGSDGETAASGYPSADAGAEVWGKILNDHADGGDRYDPDTDGEVLYDPENVPYDNSGADIDWQQFADDDITLTFGMGLHPYSTVTQPVIPAFEELTGIEVEYEIFPEDRYWLEARDDLQNRREYDGMMTGLWQAAEFHANDWVRDLTEFIEDDDLTDRDWLAMDDFLDETIELMSFPSADGEAQLTGFPNGIEAYGAIGCDVPTFEAVDGVADHPSDEISSFSELEEAARIINESDQTSQYDDDPRAGITSRTSTTTLSSANWATMFKTHGGDWIDRERKEATLADPDSGGVESLELFGRLMRDYGPEDPGQKNWYRANNALAAGETAMIYTTPSTSGAITEEQIDRTHWISPLDAPDGGDPQPATWVWATGISQFSDNPEAAWLFVQWANSRLGNYMLSARQWQGHGPRAGTARLDYLLDIGFDETHPGITDSWLRAHEEGMAAVPTDPPAIPVDTPQNMPIMTEAAVAMNSVVRGENTAQDALADAAPTITEYAKQIPDRYVR